MAHPPSIRAVPGGAPSLWNAASPSGVGLAWLGQAGFALRCGDVRLLIDPYLSDHLGKKYRGSERPHDRMMSAVSVETFDGVDFVLCTHHHGDHMDPEALPALAARNPACRVVVPQASLQHAAALGVPAAQLQGLDAGAVVVLKDSLTIEAVPAAHETLERNERGEHVFLGYILRLGPMVVYHSGDSVPFPELVSCIANRGISVALLPINGRGKGVSGNFTFPEAVELCRAANIPYLVPHHFGMFAFNTVPRDEVAALAEATAFPRCLLPDAGQTVELGTENQPA